MTLSEEVRATMADPVLPGAEPFSFDGGDVGVLLLHGFTGSPQGLRLWGEALRDAGFTVCCPLLPGHGTHWQDLARTRHPDWVQTSMQALESLRARCSQVVVGALSFGATLALHLAAARPEAVRGLVVVNPWLFPVDHPLVPLLPVLKLVRATAPGVGGDIADSELEELAYERVPLKALASAHQLQAMVRAELAGITQPVRIYVSRQDHVADARNIAYLAEHLGAREVEVIWLERCYHVATLDCERQTIFDGSIEFVRRVTAAAPA